MKEDKRTEETSSERTLREEEFQREREREREMSCMEGRAPVRATYVNLYRWPESDAEFVGRVCGGGGERQRRQWQQPRVVDSYSCRQMYLRSYTFSRKESIPERTRRRLSKMKKKVGGIIVNGNMAPGCCCVGRTEEEEEEEEKKKKKKKKKKKCGVVRRLREVSSATVRSMFLRLLACTASVDLGDYQASS